MAYKLLSNITHEGILHEAGEVIELTAEVAENLIERGLVEATDELTKVKEEVTQSKPEVEPASDPLVPPTVGPSEVSATPTEPTVAEIADSLQQTSTPNTPASSETTSPNLHLG